MFSSRFHPTNLNSQADGFVKVMTVAVGVVKVKGQEATQFQIKTHITQDSGERWWGGRLKETNLLRMGRSALAAAPLHAWSP